MGKTSISCLKIITCAGAGDSSENEDLAPSETKSSSDKRRWSFRKKAAGQRVLSSSVISEPPSAASNKETVDATAYNFDSPIHSIIPEKAHVEDKPRESSSLPGYTVKSEVAYTHLDDNKTPAVDDNPDESVVVIIQAAVRGYLAQKELLKIKTLVKFQAAIRGYLVRREAVDTMRCVQAIVKMQALVRVHHAQQSSEKLAPQEYKKGKVHSCVKTNKIQLSIQILLSNGFARQLLESSPKTKPIHIKCDSSRHDSAWKWLERWTSVMSLNVQGHNVDQGCPGMFENGNTVASLATDVVQSTDVSISSNPKYAQTEPAKPEDIGGDVTKSSGSFEFKPPASASYKSLNSAEKLDQDNSHLEDENLGKTPPNHTKQEEMMQETSNTLVIQKPLQPHAFSQSVQINSPMHADKREPFETEGRKFTIGSKRTCNPAFVAAQSKFEELSSTQSVGRSIKANQAASVQSRSDSIHSPLEPLLKTKENTLSENSVSYDSRVQMASSECGTEISISSTLDSPDRSEAEGGEIVLEIGALEKGKFAESDGTCCSLDHPMVEAETNKFSFDQDKLQPQTHAEDVGCEANLIVAVDPAPVEEPMNLAMQTHLEDLSDRQVYRSSPEGSPRSHATAMESHGTPSSQVSVNARKNKKENSAPGRKLKSNAIGKKPSSTPNNDSGGRSSADHLLKDSQNVKRRSSFGAPKPECDDQEPRISSSILLPSYMQATESARAKAHASISPKCSPDVHDKDSIKKRHSLPIANGKQDSSPRMQRSASQAQQNAKNNSTRSPHSSAERRWQR